MEDYDTGEYTDIVGDNLQPKAITRDPDVEEMELIQKKLEYLEQEQNIYNDLVKQMWESIEDFSQSSDCAILQKLSRHDQQKFYNMICSQKHPKILAVAQTRLIKRLEYLTKKMGLNE
jgi:hypothetical protein